ncbi:MAG: DNA-directed RNA polymerase subunit delta [Bacilli bacterium]|nr:DNA-directed RNA polymerase subunit delta [Bacilli bacterium]MBQ8901697.1 DNA-directed RNA polymerase subunit delta [Bacilli bacterium]
MSLKDISKAELETMGYDEIAYLILEQAGKKMKLLDLFKKVCKVLELPENTVEDRIGDFFELLSINKKFVLLPKGYWDLATNHLQNIVVEDEEDIDTSEELPEDEDLEIENEEDEDIFYDNELDDNDDEDDDLKDLVIIDEDENVQ